MDLTIAIPAYNEIETLRAVVGDALASLEELGVRGEVFLVDDGSTDGTGALADDLAAGDARIVVTHHPANQGFSGAIRSALKGRSAEHVFLAPADGQVPFEVLASFWAARDDADVIVGIRRPRADSDLRRVLSWGYHAMSRVFLGVPLPEFTSALLFKRWVVELPIVSRPRSAAALPEILCRATLAGARFETLPFRHLPRAGGTAKGGSLRVILRTFADLLRIAWTVRVRGR